MILTNYLIDVLTNLSCLVSVLSAIGCAVVLLSALEESGKSRPSKAKLVFFVFAAFVCMGVFVAAPNEEIIRCLVMG